MGVFGQYLHSRAKRNNAGQSEISKYLLIFEFGGSDANVGYHHSSTMDSSVRSLLPIGHRSMSSLSILFGTSFSISR